MNERLDEIVVDFPEAMIREAEQIKARGWGRHPFEFVDGIKLHERSVVSDAVV